MTSTASHRRTATTSQGNPYVWRDQLSSVEWLVVEDGFDPQTANVSETLFTVGNGYLGTRGTLEEGHRGESSGTYLSGVYDRHDAAVIDLVNAPDWLALTVNVAGVDLDVQSCTVITHQRVLDLRQGVLWRNTVFRDPLGRRTRMESLRMASMADREICGLRVAITPENHDATVAVHSGIDGYRAQPRPAPRLCAGSVFDPEVKGQKWARSRHLQEVRRDLDEETISLSMRTIDSGITVAYSAAVASSHEPRRSSVSRATSV